MSRSLLYLCICLLLVTASSASYVTPGTKVKLTLDNLVTNSGGAVTFNAGEYFVNDTVIVSINDTLFIGSDATVKFAAGTFFDINGTIIVNPPTGVKFTAQNTSVGFNGVRLSFSNASLLKKLTLEYSVCLRLNDSSPIIDSCTFQFNNIKNTTAFGDGAIALFRANPIISNTSFLNNERVAIQGGANVFNAPKIIKCVFIGNNTTDQNRPQVNLGATSSTGSDTTKIINNQFLRASIKSGAIGFLPIGNVYALITGNTIKNNRYGITFNGGANINAMVSYNIIDSNNIEGAPALGGSGIAFSGGSSTSHQNVIVTGNYIRGNLWGITISPNSGGGAKPNLGNITNTDTSDDGKNYFLGNTNATTPGIDLYNNTVDDIFAQNNNWGTNNASEIESRIYHKVDDASLGLVNYSNAILPVELSSFTAIADKNNIVLNWKTESENNSSYFEIEKSEDGQSFKSIGKVAATGAISLGNKYTFTDKDVPFNTLILYKLRLVDKDFKFKYSPVVQVKLSNAKAQLVKVFPTHITSSERLTAEVVSNKIQTVTIQVLNSEGKKIREVTHALVPGLNRFTLFQNSNLPKGYLYIRFVGEDIAETVPVLKTN